MQDVPTLPSKRVHPPKACADGHSPISRLLPPCTGALQQAQSKRRLAEQQVTCRQIMPTVAK
eukprot:4950650-Prymnesium_polylepis.1